MKKVQTTLFVVVVVVLVVWRLGGKKEEGLLFFCGEREAKNQKKKSKISLLFWASLSLLSRGQQTREEKKAISSCSQTAFPPVRPSVVEKDLEDVHHRGDV